uniref:amidohydrolase family protein n=1 Tax=uncultured Sphingomonas sp. TaxID=158754 RepID=UPI0035CAD7DC
MKIVSILAAVLLPAAASAEPLAIVHATAWTMAAETPVEDATVVIDDGKIVSVVPHGGAPAGARVIDAAGHPVTPGLVNAATQLGLVEVSSAAGTRDEASETRLVGTEFDVAQALNGNSAAVALARADGLTGALSYPSKSDIPPFAGLAAYIRLRPGSDVLDHARAAQVAVIGGGQWKDIGSRAAQWQLIEKPYAEAEGKRVEGHPPIVDATIPLALFTNRESDVRVAAAFATRHHIRLIIIGGAEAWRAADVLAKADVAVVLDPEANMPVSFDALGNRLDAAALLAKAGVRIAFGLSGGAIEQTLNAGLALRTGAGLAVANGLPYYAALRALTVTPRALWGGGPGTIAAGSPADLVVWDGDPLEPATNAVAVIIEGRQVSTDNRQRALVERYRTARP